MSLSTYIETTRRAGSAVSRAGSAAVSGVGRLATLAGGGAMAAGLFTDAGTLPAILTTIAAGLGGAFLSPRIQLAHPMKKPIVYAIYLAPHTVLTANLITELAWDATEGRLVQGGVTVLWTAGVWWLRPGRLAKRIAKWPEPVIETDDTEAGQDAGAGAEVAIALPDDPAGRWWALNAAKKDGVAEGTRVIAVRAIEDRRRVAVALTAIEKGEPVPDIKTKRLSALMNVPEQLLEIQDIPGRGAGFAMLLIGPKPEAGPTPDDDVWVEIGRSALPGVTLTEINEYDMSKEFTP
ncbi:hypothetical protein [Streptomyces sp. MBT62]|uniref:hypothetical protein n=1 Tax=Streptomyces sp. MBT62 TaxID=2800410 RepID=UPI00190E1793|nr:hypothetical protein [Streptomyces sp. MBT62]MBK3567816.1 hypothetical protein [Streptomyces sp. MBT62]